MKNKYYTPEIEEFHVGFEYESFEIPLSPSFAFESKPPEWVKRKVYDINNSEYKDKAIYHVSINNNYEENVDWNKNIRVKILDEQDILDCGFIVTGGELTSGKTYFEQSGTNLGITLRPNFYKDGYTNLHIYNIKILDNNRIFDTIFSGKIKNKSELKKLLQQLEIAKTNKNRKIK